MSFGWNLCKLKSAFIMCNHNHNWSVLQSYFNCNWVTQCLAVTLAKHQLHHHWKPPVIPQTCFFYTDLWPAVQKQPSRPPWLRQNFLILLRPDDLDFSPSSLVWGVHCQCVRVLSSICRQSISQCAVEVTRGAHSRINLGRPLTVATNQPGCQLIRPRHTRSPS